MLARVDVLYPLRPSCPSMSALLEPGSGARPVLRCDPIRSSKRYQNGAVSHAAGDAAAAHGMHPRYSGYVPRCAGYRSCAWHAPQVQRVRPTLRGISTLRMACTPGTARTSHAAWDVRRAGSGTAASQRASLQERGPSLSCSSPDRRFSGNARGRPAPCPPPPRASPPPASRW
jgi:hypothetical protein